MNWYTKQLNDELNYFKDNTLRIIQEQAKQLPEGKDISFIRFCTSKLDELLQPCSECLQQENCEGNICNFDLLWGELAKAVDSHITDF